MSKAPVSAGSASRIDTLYLPDLGRSVATHCGMGSVYLFRKTGGGATYR